jgi:localization factor PodJL
MLQADQGGWPERNDARGSERDARAGSLADLARDVEDMQRRQSEALAGIVRRMRALERGDSAAAGFGPARSGNETYSDEAWDEASAEALMQSYESGEAAPDLGTTGAHRRLDWIGVRFNDLTQRIKHTLSDLRPGSTITLLEERLDQFQRRMASALEDVVRRQDLEGLRLIEEHVADLGRRLEQLQAQVARLDGIEADVRSVMEQVSDERIASLLSYDARFNADLETIAQRAAEEMHARLGAHAAPDEEAKRRHDELCRLIENSIHERRQHEAATSSLVHGLGGAVHAQADSQEELKTLLETAIRDQRQGEQNALGMLETLQQAMVGILDRMDALEAQQKGAPLAPQPEPAERPSPPAAERSPAAGPDNAPEADDAPMAPSHEDAPLAASSAPPAPEAPMEAPAADPEPTAEDDGLSPVERMRREFVADARRAKMKAAANRAEAIALGTDSPRRVVPVAAAEATKPARQPHGGIGRLFGFSPKLLVGALALVVAINGGLLLLGRKHAAPPAVEVTAPADTGPEAPASAATPTPPAVSPQETVPGPRSDIDRDRDGRVGEESPAPAPQDAAAHMAAEPVGMPLGAYDDVLDLPAVTPRAPGELTKVPVGTTLGGHMMTPEALADVYEQQVLAGLSGKAAARAAGTAANNLLPEKAGPIEAAYTPADIPDPAAPDRIPARTGGLELPPATVGPLSLRLAAANGDASAQFEVGARLAEGKGTPQDLDDAMVWYQRSAAQGFVQAQYRLGTLYERGLGVERDLSRARVWYQRAAEQGNVKSMHNLAVLAAGADRPDYALAHKWFSMAAEHGLADSQFNLAVLIENGLGTKPDLVTAYKWYWLAAKAGDADAAQRRDALKKSLPPTDLSIAQQLAQNFRAKPASPMANDARTAGEDWKKRVNNDTNR